MTGGDQRAPLAEIRDIYAGKITTWPDGRRISLVLRPAHDAFTGFLENLSPEMKDAVASSKKRHPAEEGHVIVFRDVTEKRILERRLQQAQKLESLSVLAGGIAHDFNNLLTVVLGHAELALNEISPKSPAHGSLTEITAAARRAADLSLQMLAYTGKTVFTSERVGLSELVGEMAHLLKTAIPKKVDMTRPAGEG